MYPMHRIDSPKKIDGSPPPSFRLKNSPGFSRQKFNVLFLLKGKRLLQRPYRYRVAMGASGDYYNNYFRMCQAHQYLCNNADSRFPVLPDIQGLVSMLIIQCMICEINCNAPINENLMYLPVRVAAALENRCAQATGQRMRKMKTPLISILESRIASTQEELRESLPRKKAEESNYNKQSKGVLAGSHCQGNNDGVDDTCLEGEIGHISDQERHKWHQESPVVALAAEELKERTDGATDGSNKRKRVEERFKENLSEKTLAGDNSAPRVPLPVTRITTMEQTNFFISTIRILRNAKPNQSKELFDILSSPTLPVEKAHLVEQLIWMAKEYNKKALAEELIKYQ